jgi:hypothetical protein
MTRYKSLLMVSLALAPFSQTALAKDEEESQSDIINRSKNAGSITFAYGTPDSPALALSGIDASEVTRVNEVQNFAVVLPKFTDGETAIGFDFTPSNFLSGSRYDVDTLEDYAKPQNRWGRIAHRTRISLLARDGVDDDDPEKARRSLIAAGFSTSLSDKSDPLQSLAANIDTCKKTLTLATEIAGRERFSLTMQSARKDLGDALTDALDYIIDSSAGRDKLESSLAKLERASKSMEIFADEQKIPADSRIKVDQEKIGKFRKTISNPSATSDELSKAAEGMQAFADNVFGQTSSNTAYVDPKALVGKGFVTSLADCQKEIDKTLKTARSIDVGAAALWRGATDSFGDIESGGYALWTSVRQPIKSGKDSYWVLGLTARAGFNEIVEAGDATTPDGEADTIQAWAGIERFTKTWRAAARYGYVETDFKDALARPFSKDGDRWLVSTDLRLVENVWISVSYGEAAGTVDALKGEQFLVSLKFSDPKALNIFQ